MGQLRQISPAAPEMLEPGLSLRLLGKALIQLRQTPLAGPHMLELDWNYGEQELFCVLQGWTVETGWVGEMPEPALAPLRKVTLLFVAPQVPEPTLVPRVLGLFSPSVGPENLSAPCRGQVSDSE